MREGLDFKGVIREHPISKEIMMNIGAFLTIFFRNDGERF
jgi:hypothetical protein